MECMSLSLYSLNRGGGVVSAKFRMCFCECTLLIFCFRVDNVDCVPLHNIVCVSLSLYYWVCLLTHNVECVSLCDEC